MGGVEWREREREARDKSVCTLYIQPTNTYIHAMYIHLNMPARPHACVYSLELVCLLCCTDYYLKR